MVTSTLFDTPTINGLHPTGENFVPNERDENTINLNTNCANFGKYIEYYHVTDTAEVSNEEHIAFLSLWLSRCIFCCKSLKVAKIYLTLANQLHEGRYICLNQLIFGSLYESLRISYQGSNKPQTKR